MTEKQKRGFAVMDPAAHREIASLGGITAHKTGRAHQWDSKAAKAAGRKGAETRARKRAELQKIIEEGNQA